MSEFHISGHFRSICNFFFFVEIFDKIAAGGHFGCPKFPFDRISGHFRSIGCFRFPKLTFDRNSGHFRSIQKKNFGGHFGCLKITFDGISGHFRSIRNFFVFLIFLDKMAAGGHFGWDDNVNYRTRPRYLDE